MKELLKYNFVSFWKQIRLIWAVHFVLIFAAYCAGFFMSQRYSELYSSILCFAISIFPLCVFIIGPGSYFSFFTRAGNGVMWMSSKKPLTVITASFVTAFVYYAAFFILLRLFLMVGSCIGFWGSTNIYAVNLLSGKKVPLSYRFLWANYSFGQRMGLLLKVSTRTLGKTLMLFLVGTLVGLLQSVFEVLSCGYNRKKYGVFKINFIFSWLLTIAGLVIIVFMVAFMFKYVPVSGLVTIGIFSFVLILSMYLWISSMFIEKFHTL